MLPEDEGGAALPDDEGHVLELVAGHAFPADALPCPELLVVCGELLGQFDWIDDAAPFVVERGARVVFLPRLGARHDYDPKGEAAGGGALAFGIAIEKQVDQRLRFWTCCSLRLCSWFSQMILRGGTGS